MEKHKEQEVIEEMKEKMLDVRRYSAGLRLRSVLYGEEAKVLRMEDELVDYLHYTKSILDCTKKVKETSSNPVLEAMEHRERKAKIQKRKDRELYLMLQAMEQLPTLEKELLFDYYIRNVETSTILHRQGDIVESTMHRRLRKALMNLHELLQGIPTAKG